MWWRHTHKDHSHSWVRISHGLNKVVTNLNNKEQDDDEQETSEMQFEDYALKSNARAFASRSKANAKPQRRISASSSTKPIPIVKELGPMLNQEDIQSPIIEVSKKLIRLLRHGSLPREDGKTLGPILNHNGCPLREDDGAIEFWRIKDYLQNHFAQSTLAWWKVEEHHGKRRRK